MESLGAEIMQYLSAGDWVALRGDLGTGKTTLVRGALRSVGYHGPVKSPTFTLVEPYAFSNIDVYHFDFYRIMDTEELEAMGLRDYFTDRSICFIEWPDVALQLLPEPAIEISLTHQGSARIVSLLFTGSTKPTAHI